MRRPYPDGWRYFVQLILGGTPPIKVQPDTGEIKHPLGYGRVGNDIGTQTLAAVADGHADLVVLAEEVEDIEKQLRIVNRALDRSRRATNPEFFNEDGTIRRKDKLPRESVSQRGKRKWVKSKRYKRLEKIRLALHARAAEQRKTAHNRLANTLLSYGDEHYIETMRFSALAKKSKEDKASDTGKHKSKKRFGKSVSLRSPASFVNVYEKKVLAAGGKFYRINTVKAKASQYDHSTETFTKKKLSKRWHVLSDGTKLQRNLYSAFLIQNTNETLDGFIQELLDGKFNCFKTLHDQEIERLKLRRNPASVGVGIK